ncbi:NUDIX hydrolase [Ornithinimicrobium sediminis]|uniref:NUDIX hydrolase n=1 Tax=Ornithinimicrobium sediminis TaxID=2904603 RepID=UPI001E4F70C5|nr:hypothetical protein [Ornithinimicrobium sediminis]
MDDERVRTELVAVITAVVDGVPRVLTADDGPRLPSGPLRSDHRSLQGGLRAWVEQQTGHRLGYVEQLYTFADPGRASAGGRRVISVSYLGLTRVGSSGPAWAGWYDFFPWEDRRPEPDLPDPVAQLGERLLQWTGRGDDDETARRRLRAEVTFGLHGRPWRPELALQRYELLYEAGLVPESPFGAADVRLAPGATMAHDHRRILATGVARLRAMIQYRPVVFELMPAEFTLGQLQDVVEALAGQHVHKQNFRRLVQQQDLVEETGHTHAGTGGRPAMLFRFRREVLDERQVGGTKLPVQRVR